MDITRTLAVGLIMTYRCNLKCKYCYVHTKRNIDMSLQTAKSILTPFLMTKGDLLDIKFYGGETLMAFSVIQPLVEWVESNKWERRYRFFGSTNGTLLDTEMKDWIGKRSEIFVLGLSYDGLPSTQTLNRGAEVPDIDFFIKTWPNQPIQMTINEESVQNMAKGVKYLLSKGATVHPNVAYEEREWSSEALIEYARQLKSLIEYYSQNPSAPPITQFVHNLNEYAQRLKSPLPPTRMCGAGDGFMIFDVDGTPYPCHILSPLVLNGDKLQRIKDKELDKMTDFSDKRCYDCPFSTTCPTCLACNFLYRDSFHNRDRTHCEIMKIEVQAFMKKEILRLKSKEVLSSNDRTIVDSIIMLRDYLRKIN